MRSRRLGADGPSVFPIGLGCMTLGIAEVTRAASVTNRLARRGAVAGARYHTAMAQLLDGCPSRDHRPSVRIDLRRS